MRKFKLALVLVAALAVSGLTVGASAHERTERVAIVGGSKFIPNALVQETLRFRPGSISVHSGQSVTWVDRDQVEDPHTVTIAAQSDLATTFDEAVGGNSFTNAIAGAHFTNPPTLVLNKGKPGLDRRGDSYLILPGQSVTAVVSAPAGTTLHYLCAIHPWMQGVIHVH
jgi:plastocyanin